jgi:hypothetical protein
MFFPKGRVRVFVYGEPVNELLSILVYGRLIRRRSCWANFSG